MGSGNGQSRFAGMRGVGTELGVGPTSPPLPPGPAGAGPAGAPSVELNIEQRPAVIALDASSSIRNHVDEIMRFLNVKLPAHLANLAPGVEHMVGPMAFAAKAHWLGEPRASGTIKDKPFPTIVPSTGTCFSWALQLMFEEFQPSQLPPNMNLGMFMAVTDGLLGDTPITNYHQMLDMVLSNCPIIKNSPRYVILLPGGNPSEIIKFATDESYLLPIDQFGGLEGAMTAATIHGTVNVHVSSSGANRSSKLPNLGDRARLEASPVQGTQTASRFAVMGGGAVVDAAPQRPLVPPTAAPAAPQTSERTSRFAGAAPGRTAPPAGPAAQPGPPAPQPRVGGAASRFASTPSDGTKLGLGKRGAAPPESPEAPDKQRHQKTIAQAAKDRLKSLARG